MSHRILLALIAAVISPVIMFTLGTVVLFGAGTASACSPPTPSASPSTPSPAATRTAYDSEQTTNARTIIRTGAHLDIPERGWIIAVAVALQESSLRNLGHGDLAGPDSRGLFQQRRPWGPLRERMDPATSARLFYTGGHGGQPGLLDIPGWEHLPLAQVADAVQHSSHPDTYADHEDDATALVSTVAGAEVSRSSQADREHCLSGCSAIMPSQPTEQGTQQTIRTWTSQATAPSALGSARDETMLQSSGATATGHADIAIGTSAASPDSPQPPPIPPPTSKDDTDESERDDLATIIGCPHDSGDGLSPTAAVSLSAGYTIPPSTDKPIVQAIDWALTQLGTPYHYGGDCTAPHSGIAARQCDCSSLTQMAYRAAGITLPRTTLEQISTGKPVRDTSQVRPGDLVFIPGSLGTMRSPRHVGLYIGHGLIIHAPKTGEHVTVSAISAWAPIAAIRRVH